MKFYTNVEQAGNRILVRGYEGGQAFEDKVMFNPTLYLPAKSHLDDGHMTGSHALNRNLHCPGLITCEHSTSSFGVLEY